VCRLMAITEPAREGGLDQATRLVILERMLLLSMCDEAQVDGTGVSDGVMWWKSPQPAWEAGNGWQARMHDTRPLMGHVRKSSHTTGRTVKEAHPFVYALSDEENGPELHLAHNGFFTGNDARQWSQKDLPDSDTYWAGKVLADELRRTRPERLNAQILQSWLTHFSTGSTFSLMMFYGDRFTVLRGKDRPMTAFEFGGGYILNTSAKVGGLMREYVKSLDLDIHIGETVEAAEEGSLLQFDLNGRLLEEESGKIEIKLRTYVTGASYHYEGGVYMPVGTLSSSKKASGGEKSESGSASGSSSAASTATTKTQPLALPAPAPVSSPDSTGKSEVTAEEVAVEEILSYFRQAYTPMREPLLMHWIAKSLGVEVGDPLTIKKVIGLRDLEDFFEDSVGASHFRIEAGYSRMPMLTATQRRLINIWNHEIPRTVELEVLDQLFKGELFWLSNFGCDPDVLHAALSFWSQEDGGAAAEKCDC
jgi:hypothetical protein